MFLLAKSYSFGDCVLTIAGLPIGGYGEDGGVTFEPLTPERTITAIGADGQTTANQSKDRRYRMTIRLMETSTSNTTCGGLQSLQELARGPLKTANYNQPVVFRDLNTGEAISCNQCIWEGEPTITKDATASVREWKAILPNPIKKYATL